MSFTPWEVASEAAGQMSDPNFTRINKAGWLGIYNQAVRDLCVRINLYSKTASFDVYAPAAGSETPEDALYAYPTDCVAVRGLRYVPDLTNDPYRSYALVEKFRDEFNELTRYSYPSGADPQWYYADSTGFWIGPIPELTVVDGCFLDYWAFPEDVTEELSATMSTASIVPDLARDFLKERMVIIADRRENKYQEAREREMYWVQQALPEVKQRLEDRSMDRRKNLRPKSWGRGVSGQY